MANRLADEPSSYLRTAAHQPVHWMPWGSEAFERARREDKPILLDIGAVWCHWCHVMDGESYENEETARIINESYVAVKVDRDERPDVDARYQKAIQSMTGQGGWPLTAFLLPDGRCFYGGTYFPPRDAHGRPGFPRVLTAVADAYKERKDEILRNADHLAEHLAQRTRGAGTDAAPTPQEEWVRILAESVGEMRGAFDMEHGGFGQAPKFPHPASVDLLIARGARGDTVARDMAVETLRAMRAGGIYDQLAGGFHRYSVDARWHVPHFEKMLYDNAGLLRNYVRAARAFGAHEFVHPANEIVGFLRDVLQQPGGGFGGSQDADVTSAALLAAQGADERSSSSVGDDGDFFTWTLDELKAAIPDPQLAKLMALHYDVREEGDMHHDARKCVLRLAADAETLSVATQRSVEDVAHDLVRGDELLRAARKARKAPFVDPVLYTSWNAMAIQAMLEHGGADDLALKALDRFVSSAFSRERGFSRTTDGKLYGMLDDNAQMLDALLEAHVATGDARYLDVARATADLILERFAHPDGGFADRAADIAPPAEGVPLAAPERPIQDAPTASANGVALRALLRLADATGDARYHDAALDALGKLARDAQRLSLFGGALLLAMDAAVHPAPRVVARVKDTRPWRDAARMAAGVTFAAPEDPGVPPEARAFPGEGAMVCVGTRCLAPARTPQELAARLRDVAQGN